MFQGILQLLKYISRTLYFFQLICHAILGLLDLFSLLSPHNCKRAASFPGMILKCANIHLSEETISCRMSLYKNKQTLPKIPSVQLSSVQSLSHARLFATPWITACQASLSITLSNSRSSLKLMSIKSVMPSSHLILCRPLFLLPPIPPSIRVFSNESTLHMRWPKYWSLSFSIIPSKEHPGLISFRIWFKPVWIS